MLKEPKLSTLNNLLNDSSREELIWINGYLTGIVSSDTEIGLDFSAIAQQSTPTREHEQVLAKSVDKITIVYGTDSGNSKQIATNFATAVKKSSIKAKAMSLDQYKPKKLEKEEYLFVVISTHGDGEAPDAAKSFYDYIHQNTPDLSQVKYAVLGLGDSAYPLFCQAGKDVDKRLAELGGQRLQPLLQLDTDFHEGAENWISQTTQSLLIGGTQGDTLSTSVQPAKLTKKNYTGTIATHINLNGTGSDKATYHIEIEAEDVAYQPGDAIGITPKNAPEEVAKIFKVIPVEEAFEVTYRGQKSSLKELLIHRINIKYLPERIVKKYADITAQEVPETRIDLYDLLVIYPVKDKAQFIEVVDSLEPVAPRLYSIASSPEEHTDEVHLTVARNTFKVNDKTKYGLASDFLAHLKEEEELSFYVHKNHQFKLPDEDQPIILIGPGTGIAPFRAFLAERDATGATGENWLFFGDQHFTTDFLYQTEIQDWLERGVLTRVNTAFSRDQPEKIYVQDRIAEHGKAFFEWLESGAYVYLCGAKSPMSQDVEDTVLKVIEKYGHKTPEEANTYLEQLKNEKRYLTDVY